MFRGEWIITIIIYNINLIKEFFDLKTSQAILEKQIKKGAVLPLISVIIPFYNDLKYLSEALKSCFDNTYVNMEVLIIDDCSDVPLTLQDLNTRTDKYPIAIYRNLSNRGPGYSRNIGITIAKGEYIAFLDADDLWRPQIVEKFINVFINEPKIVWVYTDGNYLVDDKFHRKPNSFYHGFHRGVLPAGEDVNKFHLQGYNYFTFSSNAFRKSALLEIGLFNEDLRVSEDWDLFVRMAERFRHGVKAINEALMVYRVNNKGRHFVNRFDYIKVNVDILENMYRRQGIFECRRKDFDRAVAVIYQRAGIQRLNASRNDEARQFLFHSKCGPLNLQIRMICLRALSFLPIIFYKTALKIYDRV